jgi:hypothetical protein
MCWVSDANYMIDAGDLAIGTPTLGSMSSADTALA